MNKLAANEPDIKRYWPNSIEESHLRYYIGIYFKFPERSNYKN